MQISHTHTQTKCMYVTNTAVPSQAYPRLNVHMCLQEECHLVEQREEWSTNEYNSYLTLTHTCQSLVTPPAMSTKLTAPSNTHGVQ